LTVSKRDKETRFNWNGNNARNRVAQVKRWSKDVSGFSTASYEFFRLVRNEEAGGSNPLSSTKLLFGAKAGCSIRLSAF
jgi:hypothetical protein